MRPHAILMLALALAVSSGQSPAQATPAPTGAPRTELPSVTLPPDLDRVLRDYERAWRAGDARTLAALFTPDGFVLQPGRVPVRGRDALAAVYAGQAGGDLRLRAVAFASADTVGYIIGGYRYGGATVDAGKFTLTLRRRPNGPWLIFSDMDNGNSP